jgi:hypothetical protein
VNRWTWHDTLLVCAATMLTLALAASLRADGAATCAPRGRAIPLDTVGCGHLEDCTPLVRVRWMSDNPFAASAAWSER